MYDDTFASLSRWVRMQPPILWVWNRFRSYKICWLQVGHYSMRHRWWEARNSIKGTKCVFCGTALLLSDTLFCVLDVASLIDSKILNSMISRRCRVLTCPCCFFLVTILFVCFSPGFKRNRKRARKLPQNQSATQTVSESLVFNIKVSPTCIKLGCQESYLVWVWDLRR